MLFKCFRCGLIGFNIECKTCGPEYLDDYMPITPKNMGHLVFAQKQRGVQPPLLFTILDAEISTILEKYNQFEHPYFVNFVRFVGVQSSFYSHSEDGNPLGAVFLEVLHRLGFGGINQIPGLTRALVLITCFRLDYSEFVAQTSRHVSERLEPTLRSWIEERGAIFRTTLPMLLYYLWENDRFTDEVDFNAKGIPLVKWFDLDPLLEQCEQIYLDIQVTRFKLTLENFDPSSFITMYTLDGMQGYEFENFLGSLFKTIGYDVEVTKRSGDQGADLFAERFGKKIVIQAKNYYDSVGNSAIQQVLAARLFYGCDEAMVITNSYFTPSAKELAEATGVRLVDRTQLQVYLDEYNQTMAQGYKPSSLSLED